MRGPLIRASIGVIGALTVAAMLAGCAESKAAAPEPSRSADPAPTSSASATPAKPSDTLFTVTANVRGKDGSTIAVQLTAHQPVPSTASGAKPLEAEFLKACGGDQGDGTPVTADTLAGGGSVLVSLDLASSVVGKPFAYPLDLSLGSPDTGWSASGKGITPTDSTAPCTSGYRWGTSGTAHGVADFESGSTEPDPTLWRFARYGFSVPFDSGATIEACTVNLTDLARPIVAGVAGWDASAPASGIDCSIGYVGE